MSWEMARAKGWPSPGERWPIPSWLRNRRDELMDGEIIVERFAPFNGQICPNNIFPDEKDVNTVFQTRKVNTGYSFGG